MNTETQETEHHVYEFFRFGVVLKGLISIAEVVAGILILVIPHTYIVHFVQVVADITRSQERYGFLLSHITKELEAFTTGAVVFLALYLLSRGLIKAGIIWGLLANKLWAYPVSLIVLGLFLIYQLYQIATTHSILVVGITLFDIFVMYFIWREYKIVTSHGASFTPS